MALVNLAKLVFCSVSSIENWDFAKLLSFILCQLIWWEMTREDWEEIWNTKTGPLSGEYVFRWYIRWWSDTIKPHSFSVGENQWSSIDLKYTFKKNLPKFVTWLPFRILLSIAIIEWGTKQSRNIIYICIFSLSNPKLVRFQIMIFSKLVSLTL